MPPPWFATFKAMREPLTASAAQLRDASKRVGLVEVVVHEIDVDLAGLDPSGLAAYRLGMAHVQDHLDAMTPAARVGPAARCSRGRRSDGAHSDAASCPRGPRARMTA